MSTEVVKRDIDGRVYEFSQFGASASVKMLSRLTRLVGEPLLLVVAAGVKNFKSGSKLLASEVDNDLVAKAVKELIMRVGDDREVLDVVQTLTSKGVLCDNKPIAFETHFGGGAGLAHMMRVLVVALEVQYGDFISALFGSVGLFRASSSTGSGSPSQG